ncbi:tetratricopeptide repeat protein [Streptomyces coeruleorubidus]|uniref:Tetratricopeptide repeat protein n=1 Tax=Streptomyces coeruleorubidus TaxID=116188 RepID=A0ABZ0KLG5_STRC4|nr:tetratricopeptide repeat protein [Streptomyces coeruleorubidus]WOT38617.1 tetratricopeptide repeat protein [Streptomyces coeruleorubidus]
MAADNARVYQVDTGHQVNVEGDVHVHHHVTTDRPKRSAAVSLTPPFRLLPRRLYGRTVELEELAEIVHGATGTLTVLHGMGGLGKTALALSIADEVRRRRRRVFWIAAADVHSVREAMLQVASSLGASDSLVQEAAAGAVDVADLLWSVLDEAPEAWLLVLDGADDPTALEEGLGTEWIRASFGGAVLITTRVGSAEVWPGAARMTRPALLSAADGGEMLIGTAGLSEVSRDDEGKATQLADRLGGVPLALWLAGRYMAMPASANRRFDDYRAALDRDFPETIDKASATSGVRGPERDLRRLIMQTWELSLDFLEKQGLPQARTLMRLLSCFATRPVPAMLLSPKVLTRACGAYGPWDDAVIERSLNALSEIGLVDIGWERLDEPPRGERQPRPDMFADGVLCAAVHPLVAEVNAAQLSRSEAHAAVWSAAVRCLGRFRGVWPEEPSHVNLWQLLVPHVLSLSERLPGGCDDLLRHVAHINAWFCEYLRVSGQYGVAYDVTEATYQRSRRLADNAPERFLACYTHADWSWRISRLEEAEQTAREACRLAALLDKPHSFRVLAADSLLAAIVVERGDVTTGEKLVRDIIARLNEAWPLDHALSIQAHHHLATILRVRGTLEEAEEEGRLAVSLCESIPDFPLFTEAVIRHELGVILWHRGRLDDAMEVFDGVMRLQHSLLPPSHPSILITRFDVASINKVKGNLVKAFLEFKEISLIEADSLGENHYTTLQSRHNMAQILVQMGRRLDEAEAILKGIVAAREESGLGTRHEDVLATKHELVHILSQRGKWAKALREWRRILDEEREHLGPNHPSTLRTHFNWAVGWAHVGQLVVARGEMRRVLSARRHTFGDDHHETEEARKALAELNKHSGRPWWHV